MTTKTELEWVTTVEAARRTGVSSRTVLRWAQAGKLERVRQVPGPSRSGIHHLVDPVEVEAIASGPIIIERQPGRASGRAPREEEARAS